MELQGLGFWEQLTHTAFWVAVVQIIVIDILLAGDNAVVIALACRNLPPHLQKKGIFWGVAGAIISGGKGTAQEKLAVMDACGIKVTKNPAEMGTLLRSVL